ncbi:MAG TPA: hydroxyethylthiazole kinase [Aminivibrio sp.]|nr:hydroxyethylthiazole kinase [Aminivibrio sp.]MEA4953435.1 hydroxyethylthiazole kinase [Aminivibrio sp.]HPF83839.1 hydroxyethylthiazole kinase [Aminivibrio sp.]
MDRKIGLADLSPRCWTDALEQVRRQRPLVYTITSFVSASFQADGTIAAGGSPVMSRCPREAAELAASADSIVINTGTPDESALLAMNRAVKTGKKIVFDPVGYGATAFRTAAVNSLLSACRPSVIKGNYGEIRLLAGQAGEMRGVDSECATAPLVPVMQSLAGRTGALICATGPVDIIADGASARAFSGGSALMARISGGGCLLGSLMGVLISGGIAAGASAAVVMLRLAAERAEERAKGPGAFRAALLDELASLAPEDLMSQEWRMCEPPEGGTGA